MIAAMLPGSQTEVRIFTTHAFAHEHNRYMVGKLKDTENKVFLDSNDVVWSVYHGPQTAATLLKTTTEILEIMRKLVEHDKPVRLLADIRDMGGYDQPARIVEMQSRTALPFWKLAYVTTDKQPEGEKLSRIITAMSARRQEIRYFQREDDALGWLSFMRHNSPTQKPAMKAG